MKVLIASDGVHAHFFERAAWANAFNACGIQSILWDCKKIPAFDIFDTYEPDIFLGQTYNLEPALIKCIYERPHLKVALRAGDWGDQESIVDKSRYNILYCSSSEKQILQKLKDETGKPDFVYIHYDETSINITHNHFRSIGIEPKSVMMSADIMMYSNAQYDPKLDCDIAFVGGYWPYKGLVINQYLFPLMNDVGKYNIKIFGNQVWPSNQYCGMISDTEVKNLFVSAKICPNLSEPHAHAFGIDVNERIFKILFAGGFCISDYVDSYKLFGDGLIMAKTPDEFQNKIEYYLNHPSERIKVANIGQSIVKKYHTSFDRIAQIMHYFNMPQIANLILTKKLEIINV